MLSLTSGEKAASKGKARKQRDLESLDDAMQEGNRSYACELQ